MWFTLNTPITGDQWMNNCQKAALAESKLPPPKDTVFFIVSTNPKTIFVKKI
jgi:hypothetical protein